MSGIGSKLKKGFTTGTCAQAAAKGAAYMLATRKPLKKVKVETPSGAELNLDLIEQRINKESAFCGVIKDSGDDPDITNGIKIYAEVKFSSKAGVNVTGGKGVGRVARPGLAVAQGEYAINPVPKKMIIKEVSLHLPEGKGAEVIISAPEGERLAEYTFNPRLGITGGISIIGTTGMVEPKSTDAYKSSLSLQLNVLKAEGHEMAVLVLGYVGERFAKKTLKINGRLIVKIGDHIGFMLEECLKKGIKEVILIGHIGKLIKITKDQFNTHFEHGDNRIEPIAHYAESSGAKKEIIKKLLEQTTAEATVDILKQNGLMSVFDKIAQDIVIKANKFLSRRLYINCILLSLKGEVLAAYPKGEYRHE